MVSVFRNILRAVLLASAAALPAGATNIDPVGPAPDFTYWASPIPAEAYAVYFEPHSARLTAKAEATLDQAAPILAQYTLMFTSLRGFASNVEVADEDEAIALGLERAQAVKAHLVARGVPEHLLVPYSAGTRGIINPKEGNWGAAEVTLCVLAVAEKPVPEDAQKAMKWWRHLQQRYSKPAPAPRA